MIKIQDALSEAADKEYPTYFYRSPIDEHLAQGNAFKRDAFKAGHRWTIEYLAGHQNESLKSLLEIIEQYKKEIEKLEAEILELKRER